MYRYEAFGLVIDSELELPDLRPGDGTPDVAVRLGWVASGPRRATPFEEVRSYRNLASFHIRDGREITVSPVEGADWELVRLVLMGSTMAYLMRQRGWLPLHAGGVKIGGQAVLFLGESGAGKSTTVAAFYRRGHAVITDDVGAVQAEGSHWSVCPSFPRVRLHENSREVMSGSGTPSLFRYDKHIYAFDRAIADRTIPLARIYFLEFGEAISAAPLPPLESVLMLSTHSFGVRRRMNRDALRIHMRDCASLAAHMPVYNLTRPRSLNALNDLVSFVENDLDT